MHAEEEYDIAIVGGGLAGLALAIQLARERFRVILFEKEKYPFHKVCGEYISLESWDFLKGLDLDLDNMQLPLIKKLEVSATNGNLLQHELPLGGFGISRYRLDENLANLAVAAGAVLRAGFKVNDVNFADDSFTIETSQQTCHARVVCGSFGKRSNLDLKWKRAFTSSLKHKLNNYIGVKYHIQSDFPHDTIALHNFENGYCGIVKIEEDKYNLCYLTTALNLQRSHNSIAEMERNILMKNPHLKRIFSESRFLFDAPLAISQISFDQKSQVEGHILMTGDAAGMITPLCGNGMSMALHSSKLAAAQIQLFLQGQLDRGSMELQYTRLWKESFANRMRVGRRLQTLFSHPLMINSLIRVGKTFPRILDPLIRKTHGHPF